MIVKIIYENNILKLFPILEKTDYISYISQSCSKLKTQKYSFTNKSVWYYLNDEWSLQNFANDKLLLVVLLTFYPFIGDHLKIFFKPSCNIINNILNKLKIKIIVIENDSKISNIIINKNEKKVRDDIKHNFGLALSCGVDSLAALYLMPKNTISIFLDRVNDIGFCNYSKDKIYTGLKQLKNIYNKKIIIVRTNLEYVCNPCGFPIDISVSIPLILYSELYNIDSISFGYCVHDIKYYISKRKDICTGCLVAFDFFKWNEIFGCCNLQLSMPVSGLSEFGTMKILLNSEFKDLSTWCLKDNSPCMNCSKCYRKNMIKTIILSNNSNILKNKINTMLTSKYFNYNLIIRISSMYFIFIYITYILDDSKNDIINKIKGENKKYWYYLKFYYKWNNYREDMIDSRLLKSIYTKLEKLNML